MSQLCHSSVTEQGTRDWKVVSLRSLFCNQIKHNSILYRKASNTFLDICRSSRLDNQKLKLLLLNCPVSKSIAQIRNKIKRY